MSEIVNIQVSPKEAATSHLLELKVARLTGVKVSDIVHVQILKRSIDARQKAIKINLRLAVFTDDSFQEKDVCSIKVYRIRIKANNYRKR